MAAHYFPGPTISKRYTTLVDVTLFIGIIMVSTVCGKCGMLYAVTESISVVNKPPD